MNLRVSGRVRDVVWGKGKGKGKAGGKQEPFDPKLPWCCFDRTADAENGRGFTSDVHVDQDNERKDPDVISKNFVHKNRKEKNGQQRTKSRKIEEPPEKERRNEGTKKQSPKTKKNKNEEKKNHKPRT